MAALLSGFLLGSILLGILLEAATAFFIDWSSYTGYRQTLVAVLCILIVYFVSRTHRLELAAILTVSVVAGGAFLAAYGEPRGVEGGLFDFLILPLWIGSLFISLKRLAVLIVCILGALVLFPLAVPAVSLDTILVGPFTFVFITSVLLLIITHYRNRLEQDRRAELAAKEESSRHAAARADALLRVADVLNAQLDVDTVLSAIAAEVSRALNTPVSIVTLYDRLENHFYPAASIGLPFNLTTTIPPLGGSIYDETVRRFGPVFAITDLQSLSGGSLFAHFEKHNLRSIAFATMKYEQDLIGSLSAITIGEPREFSSDELLLLQGIADQAALALVNTRLYKDARRRLERLQALRAIDIAIITNRDLHENLQVLLQKIIDHLKVDAAAFLLLDATGEYLEFGTSRGFNTHLLDDVHLRLGEGIAGRAAAQRKTIHIRDLRNDPQIPIIAPILLQEEFATFYAAPLIAQERVRGVLEIFHRCVLTPDEEWLSFLEALAGQAAIAIESTTLFQDLQRANDELSQAYDSTIEGWSRALELRDHETEGHTRRVTEMTMRLARALGYSKQELVQIRRGALLHDIGKMGVPDGILGKPGSLTDAEWTIMRRHPDAAYKMLSPIDYLKPALDIPYCHHEKWDGTGYPRGLSGEQIPLSARIFALADVYDALTSDRPYRAAWSQEQALTYIRTHAGSHFDPTLVEKLSHLLAQET